MSVYRNSAEAIKDTHPVLYRMYDSSDPEHTFGCSDYFIDQLEEFLEDSESEEEKEIILREIEFVSKYDEIEIY